MVQSHTHLTFGRWILQLYSLQVEYRLRFLMVLNEIWEQTGWVQLIVQFNQKKGECFDLLPQIQLKYGWTCTIPVQAQNWYGIWLYLYCHTPYTVWCTALVQTSFVRTQQPENKYAQWLLQAYKRKGKGGRQSLLMRAHTGWWRLQENKTKVQVC